MKLQNLLKQIPVRQDLMLVQNMQELACGNSACDKILSYGNMTVGLISAEDNKLIINVYER